MMIFPLGDCIYLHITWHNYEKFGRFPANGVIYVKNGHALLLDTPVTNEQTEQLVQIIQEKLNADITLFIPNHFHEDCMGGLEYLQSLGIPSISLERTREICEEKGLPIPDEGFTNEYQLTGDFAGVICFYPGKAHTEDNISVYFPDQGILFAGCMAKSLKSKGLGNLADAFPEEWAQTIQTLMDRFPDAQIIIPGHGSQGGRDLLEHTKQLVEEYGSTH